MRKVVFLLCIVALLAALASAAFANQDGSRLAVWFKAGWPGSSGNAATTVFLASDSLDDTHLLTPSASSYNIATIDWTYCDTVQRVPGSPGSTYSFTLVVAPGTSVTEHSGDPHQGMVYISAWNLESYAGGAGYTLADNYRVSVSGSRMVGSTITWSKSDLLLSSAPDAASAGPVGFWYNYGGAHYSDWASAMANNTLIVTISPVPEPGSLVAFGSSLIGLAGFAIRRRKA